MAKRASPHGTIFTTAVYRAAEEIYSQVPFTVVAQERRGHRGGVDTETAKGSGDGVWVMGWLYVSRDNVLRAAKEIVRERVRAGNLPRHLSNVPVETILSKRLR